jgi:carboxymethylenebutenolidase
VEEISLQAPGGALRAAVARPTTSGPWPGVVVLHEAFGLTDDIVAHAERFAQHGYLAIAPDLFSWGSPVRCLVACFAAMLRGSGRPLDAVEAARAWLAAQPGCSGRVGVIGFCMGGGFALVVAPRFPFAAAAPNYGYVPFDAERALAGACPIVASYGARDFPMRGMARRLDSALTTLGIDHDVKEYADASHSFLNHHDGWKAIVDRISGMGYHEASAEDAWRRIINFFERHVRTSSVNAA